MYQVYINRFILPTQGKFIRLELLYDELNQTKSIPVTGWENLGCNSYLYTFKHRKKEIKIRAVGLSFVQQFGRCHNK